MERWNGVHLFVRFDPSTTSALSGNLRLMCFFIERIISTIFLKQISADLLGSLLQFYKNVKGTLGFKMTESHAELTTEYS